MGLDGIEFLLAVEDAFAIAIPDKAAEQILTPGQLVEYLVERVGATESGMCLEQRAFYRIRAAAIGVFGLKRADIRPEAGWEALLPPGHRRAQWRALREAVGLPGWPSLSLFGKVPAGVSTVGSSVRHVAARSAGELRPSGEQWSRSQVEVTIRALMADHLNIKNFRWDQHFVKELGVDQ